MRNITDGEMRELKLHKIIKSEMNW